MEELRYQVDLLGVKNQKLEKEERMLRLVCDTSSNAFLYMNFEEKEAKTLANWNFFFPDVEIINMKDVAKLYSKVEERYVLPFKELLNLEKTGISISSGVVRLADGKTWVECEVSVIYDAHKNPTDKVIRFKNISKFKNQNEELTYMAYYDVLTGLYNRNYFVRHLADYVRKAEDEKRTFYNDFSKYAFIKKIRFYHFRCVECAESHAKRADSHKIVHPLKSISHLLSNN